MVLITYFERFISNIQPSEERVSSVSDAHNILRSHLIDDANLEYAVNDSFLSGSYARHTAIQPIKDADIIIILEKTKVSDDRKSPKVRNILKDIRSAIDDFYDSVNLETQRRSIQVHLTEDDVRMDIVPAIAPNGKDKRLFVPDYHQQEWVLSHPRAHITSATEVNAKVGGRFVRVTKALKWWRSNNLIKSIAPKSFLLEVIVAYNMDNKTSNVCEAFAATLKNILESYRSNKETRTLPKIPDPGLPENDLAETCGWAVSDFLYFYDRIAELSATAEKANSDKTSKEKTITLWKSVFGDVYPNTLTEEEEEVSSSSAALPEPVLRRRFPYDVRISARIAYTKGGRLIASYPSNGSKLKKELWLRFKIDGINVPAPYRIKWAVRNHGIEARKHKDLNHERYPGDREQWERTGYRGHHFMDCEIYKDGQIVAKARHIVNVK